MGRARSKNPKVTQHCLRLTAKQEELLQLYTDFREFNTQMDAIRAMIDGLESWLSKQAATKRSTESDSGLPHQNPTSMADRGDVQSISAIDATSTSVGDFAGRPAVGLPESTGDSDFD